MWLSPRGLGTGTFSFYSVPKSHSLYCQLCTCGIRNYAYANKYKKVVEPHLSVQLNQYVDYASIYAEENKEQDYI